MSSCWPDELSAASDISTNKISGAGDGGASFALLRRHHSGVLRVRHRTRPASSSCPLVGQCRYEHACKQEPAISVCWCDIIRNSGRWGCNVQPPAAIAAPSGGERDSGRCQADGAADPNTLLKSVIRQVSADVRRIASKCRQMSGKNNRGSNT